jgi:hypothetical protein
LSGTLFSSVLPKKREKDPSVVSVARSVLLETKHVPGSAAGTMGGKERMNSISALKVAVSENLVYGLIFLPLWFRNKDGGSLRVALWLSRMLVSTTLGIVITNGFRNGDIPSYARCACINGRALASMQYSSPPFVQPSCNSSDGNATSLWTASLRFPLFFLETRGGDLASEL